MCTLCLTLQNVPPDLAICTFILEQSLSVRALVEMLANTVEMTEVRQTIIYCKIKWESSFYIMQSALLFRSGSQYFFWLSVYENPYRKFVLLLLHLICFTCYLKYLPFLRSAEQAVDLDQWVCGLTCLTSCDVCLTGNCHCSSLVAQWVLYGKVNLSILIFNC